MTGVQTCALPILDLEGHIDDVPLKEALQELEKESILVKMLGSYPRAESHV